MSSSLSNDNCNSVGASSYSSKSSRQVSPATTSSSNDYNDSGSSPSGSFSFDMSLDPSDPLNFLMYSDNVSSQDIDTDSSMQAMWPDQPSSYSSLSSSFESGNSNEDEDMDIGVLMNSQNVLPQLKLDGSFVDPVNMGMNLGMGMGMGTNMDFAYEHQMSNRMPSVEDFDSNIFNQAMLSLGLDISQLPSDTANSNSSMNVPEYLSSSNAHQFGIYAEHDAEGPNYLSSTESSKSSSSFLSTKQRRLSVTSSSSSSNASLSPVVGHASPSNPSSPLIPSSPSNAPSPTAPSTSAPGGTPTTTPQFETAVYDFSSFVFSAAAMENAVRELAQRARERAGVVAASPNVDAESQLQAAKVPIPRLARPTPPVQPATVNAKRKSPDSSPSPEESSNIGSTSTDPSTASPPTLTQSETQPLPHKPKTSHTTIERRYRTNLNARIQALRNAVPALRVLEQKDGNRVGNLAIKSGSSGKTSANGTEEVDVVDARGYIDGVKVARKGSKANVLGKAVEYIRVLKRREHRLKKEQMGLKILLCTLIGGPELLAEWEKEWTNKFGGAERDELDPDADEDGEDGDGEGEINDEDDEGDGDDDDGEDERKKRKRAKVDDVNGGKAGKGSSQDRKTTPQQPKEKRKRGRPRKNPSAADSFITDHVASASVAQQRQEQNEDIKMHDLKVHNVEPLRLIQIPSAEVTLQPAQAQGGQYLLAAFAFFSFFNSPGSILPRYYNSDTASSEAHTHTGTVLTSVHFSTSTSPSAMIAADVGLNWQDLLHISHLVVSILLFLSVVVPWLPKKIHAGLSRFLPRALTSFLGLFLLSGMSATSSPVAADAEPKTSVKEKSTVDRRSSLVSALQLNSESKVSSKEEAEMLYQALGIYDRWWSILISFPRWFISDSVKDKKTRSNDGLELSMLEQRAWVRLAEIIALEGNTKASLTTRLQIYLFTSKYLPIFTASAADLSTLALVVKPFWSTKAETLWTLAKNSVDKRSGALSGRVCKPFEAYVLEKMTVDDATEKLANLFSDSGRVCGLSSPLSVLAAQLVRDSVRIQAEKLFISQVLGEDGAESISNDTDDIQKDDFDARKVIEVGRCLDETTTSLVNLLEVIQSNTCSRIPLSDLSKTTGSSEEHDLFSLLYAFILYRRIFPSTDDPSRGTYLSRQCDIQTQRISSFIPSPPPSPQPKNTSLHLALRRALDSAAFDRGDALEDARDYIVDMLTMR